MRRDSTCRRHDVAPRVRRRPSSGPRADAPLAPGCCLVLIGLVLASGCVQFQVPRIDPTGESVFLEPPVRLAPDTIDEPGVRLAWDPVAVTLTPGAVVAPIGSQVVLVAGVLGEDNFLQTNRRLEWSIAPGGPGYFLDVGRTGAVDVLLGDFNWPRKVDNRYAIGSTLRQYYRLERGTPDPGDDVCVARGQGWVSLTSPVEGTSHVSVHAPEVHAWQCRTRTATVHWIDAQFNFPSPAINRAGTVHPLVTTVTRQSDGTPLPGWIVRYRILSGPSAVLGAEGGQSVEVPTDASGRATVDLLQIEPAAGTNTIGVEIFRPGRVPGAPASGADCAGCGPAGRLLVGNSTTTKTWTAASLTVRKTGPQVGSVGATLSYQITVANPGDMPAEGVTVRDTVPEGLDYVGSNPPAELQEGNPQWAIGVLAPGEQRTLQVDFRANTAGSITNCAEATASGGLSANACATTQITSGPSLDVQVNGPRQARVGQSVRFAVIVTNRGEAPSGMLLIRDRYDEGFQHELNDPNRVIEADLGSLEPGQSQQVNIDFTVAQAGRWCHTVEVLDPAGARATGQACLEATAAARPPGGGQFGGDAELDLGQPNGDTAPSRPSPGEQPTQQPSEQSPPRVSVRKRGPTQATAGQMAQFVIEVTNTGSRPAIGLRVADQYDPALHPKLASDGYEPVDGQLVWQIDRLGPGQVSRFEVRCECLRATARACNRVDVSTSRDGTLASDEVCFPISASPTDLRPAPGRPGGGLSITATDLHDPISVGKEMTYVVQVTNGGIVPDGDVQVVASVPAGMVPVPMGTIGPRLDGSVLQAQIVGQQVRFPVVPEVAPGKTLIYRVRVRTSQAGQMEFAVQATSRRHPQPVTATAKTLVQAR